MGLELAEITYDSLEELLSHGPITCDFCSSFDPPIFRDAVDEINVCQKCIDDGTWADEPLIIERGVT